MNTEILNQYIEKDYLRTIVVNTSDGKIEKKLPPHPYILFKTSTEGLEILISAINFKKFYKITQKELKQFEREQEQTYHKNFSLIHKLIKISASDFFKYTEVKDAT